MNKKLLAARFSQHASTIAEPWDSKRLMGYIAELADLNPDACYEAFNTLARRDKWMPRPAEIRTQVAEDAKNNALKSNSVEPLASPGITGEEYAAGIVYLDSLKS